ncbi:hypothetical protein [Paraburkholderia sp.]|uniref:hypothetical protein n=1 Tax=Paraburkholderia sp. TaxID=1926495 RepID=UPI002D3A402E|nr:hypothetical protein [Paraburkholderia sp.]HZZ03336.1 hypothetical protein [Paraburkholderia sp.]
MKRMIVLTSTAIVLMATQAHAQTSAPPTNPQSPMQNAVQHSTAAQASNTATPTNGSTHASSKAGHHRRTMNQRRKLYRHH